MRQKLAEKVGNEFAEVQYPGDQNIGIREVDDFIGQQEWQKVPLELLSRNQTALLSFSPAAYHFYLPAFLCAVLRHPHLEYLEFPITYSLIPADTPEGVPEQSIPLFNRGEKSVIVEFLEKHGELFPQSSYTLLPDSVAELQHAIEFWKTS